MAIASSDLFRSLDIRPIQNEELIFRGPKIYVQVLADSLDCCLFMTKSAYPFHTSHKPIFFIYMSDYFLQCISYGGIYFKNTLATVTLLYVYIENIEQVIDRTGVAKLEVSTRCFLVFLPPPSQVNFRVRYPGWPQLI